MVICGSDETKAILDRIAPDEECERLARESFEKWMEARKDLAPTERMFTQEQMEILSLAFEALGAPDALERAVDRWMAGERV